MIKIQKEDFEVDSEIKKIKSLHPGIGAVSIFIGYVRNINEKKEVKSIKLDVYKDMAIKNLKETCSNVIEKWSLIDCLVIHRYGHLFVHDKIVLVATFSKNRKDSSESCNYIMNYLKKDAPFWKKEFYNDGSSWLENIN